MKEYTFHSPLPPEEIVSRLRARTRPWSRWDAGSARNAWFLRQREGKLRLVRTGPGRSYIFADLTLADAADGTEITAALDLSKTYTLDITVVVLMASGLALAAALQEFWGGLKMLVQLCWLLPISLWTGSLTRKQAPELLKFIEDVVRGEEEGR